MLDEERELSLMREKEFSRHPDKVSEIEEFLSEFIRRNGLAFSRLRDKFLLWFSADIDRAILTRKKYLDLSCPVRYGCETDLPKGTMEHDPSSDSYTRLWSGYDGLDRASLLDSYIREFANLMIHIVLRSIWLDSVRFDAIEFFDTIE
jgi:hypothetical protein